MKNLFLCLLLLSSSVLAAEPFDDFPTIQYKHQINDNLSPYALEWNGKNCILQINNIKQNPKYQIFNLAHEAGHCAMFMNNIKPSPFCITCVEAFADVYAIAWIYKYHRKEFNTQIQQYYEVIKSNADTFHYTLADINKALIFLKETTEAPDPFKFANAIIDGK